MLWRQAVRRHPGKGVPWVKENYFKTRGTRTWTFAATEKQEDGKRREFILLRESDTPIQRHIKIEADAHPHDPKWAPYFESRWGRKKLRSSKDRGKLYRVWRKQEGLLCPTCQASITKSIPWDVRRIVKKMRGGSDALSNLQMHHLNCRRNQVHANNTVV